MDSEVLIHVFYNRLAMQRYAKNTIRSYCSYAQIFLEYMNNYNSLEEIPLSEIEFFINNKVIQENISASYQRSLVGAIKKIYELTSNQNIQLNYLYPKRKTSQLPKFFSQKEVKKILNASNNLKHKAILTTIYSCGLRLSEVINLKIVDVKSDSGLLLIKQSKGNKDRMVSLPDKLLQLLRDYYVAFRPQVFYSKDKKGHNIVKEVFSLF